MKGRPSFAVILGAFALLHFLLSACFAYQTPYRTAGKVGQAAVPDIGAPDERQHANTVQWIRDGKGLPVFRPGTPDFEERYEDHQPPLYYGLAAGFAAISGAPDVADQGAIRLRLLNCILGAATVLGVGFGVFWGLQRQRIALCAASIAAFLPMNCAISGSISNDPLLYSLVTWAIAILARGTAQGWTLRLGALLGLLMGLSVLTKTSGLLLGPVWAITLLVNRQSWRPLLLAGALMGLFGLPLWLRNQSLYGDPFTMKAFNMAFANSPTPTQMIEGPNQGDSLSYWLNWFGWWTTRSFFGVFGYMDLFMNELGNFTSGPKNPNLIYRLLTALFAVSALGTLVQFSNQKEKEFSKVHLIFATALAITALLYLGFNLKYFQAQARYLFPALLPICAAFALGWKGILGERFKLGWTVLPLALLLFNGYCLTRLGPDFEKKVARPAQDVSASVR